VFTIPRLTMSRILFPVVALIGLSTMLQAQQVDDFALRFNGATDFVAMPQTVTATNSFTIEMWVYPTEKHEIDAESFAGYDGIRGQRYALYPSHGTHCWGPGHAGVGLSVGTNGVSVYEHAGDYIPAVLVHEAAITGWTRVTLVYRDRVPSLYLDGRLVRTGRQSPMQYLHPSSGDGNRARQNGAMFGGFGGGVYGYFAGDLDNVRIWSAGLTEAEVTSPSRAGDERVILSLGMNQSGAGLGLIVANSARIDNASLVLTYGTQRTPYFTHRGGTVDARYEVPGSDRSEVSSPIEYYETVKATTGGPAAVPTLE
jgi:hypothetical protein